MLVPLAFDVFNAWYILSHRSRTWGTGGGETQKIVRALAPAPLNVEEIVQPREAARIEPTVVEWSKPTLYVPPQPDPKHPLKIGSEFYPDGSVRAGEQGRCTVQITEDIGGQVTHASLQ